MQIKKRLFISSRFTSPWIQYDKITYLQFYGMLTDLNWKSCHYTGHKKYSAIQEKIKTRWVWNEKLQEHQMVEYGTGKYSFTEEDKISIVSEYVCGHVPASVIVEKYHIGTRQTLFNWMDKYVNRFFIILWCFSFPPARTDTKTTKNPLPISLR